MGVRTASLVGGVLFASALLLLLRALHAARRGSSRRSRIEGLVGGLLLGLAVVVPVAASVAAG